MADIAHEMTDEIIKKIEKRLKREYAQAKREIEEKLDDYFRRFEIKDKKWDDTTMSSSTTITLPCFSTTLLTPAITELASPLFFYL